MSELTPNEKINTSIDFATENEIGKTTNNIQYEHKKLYTNSNIEGIINLEEKTNKSQDDRLKIKGETNNITESDEDSDLQIPHDIFGSGFWEMIEAQNNMVVIPEKLNICPE